jgi:sialate O-acetylesterase
MKIKHLLLALACGLPLPSIAALQPNSLFSDHAVLQRGTLIPVWGTADAGEKVTVQFDGEARSAVTGQGGKWSVTLAPLEAGGPFAMTISGSSSTLEIHDVYVGEVWVCSGQSNMERQLGPRPPQPLIDNWEQEASTADFPQIHEYFVPEKLSKGTSEDSWGHWEPCTPQTAPKFSAVSFFFARALYEDIKVPIGLLFTAWGGTTAESWTSEEALKADAGLADIVTAHERYTAGYPAVLDQYRKQTAALLDKYKANAAAALAAGSPSPAPFHAPRAPVAPETNMPGRLYNAMVAPLIHFPIRGVIWYQGESNGGRGVQYRVLFPALIADWRARWREGDFPFLFVQIAPYRAADPAIREAQLLTALHTPETAMTVTADIGDPANIHPPHKRPVGERLALAARALAYGEKIEYSGPLFASATPAGGKIAVTFTHAGGLTAKGGPAAGFQIAGPDQKFVPAAAEISGSTVLVSSAAVANPQSVRYGWSQVPDGNLFNAAGLPASPFRTDSQ